MISTAAEARALVAACLYPPAGRRSFGPVRSASYGQATSYLRIANDEVLILPMIETQEAVDNIAEILDVPGIGGLYIGPSDLAISLGVAPVLDTEDPTMLGVYETLLRETSARGQIAGIHNLSPAYASRMVGIGFRFVTVGNDSRMIAGTAKETVQSTRTMLERLSSSSV
jgi:4-hydroxy-2-oxoheptanedioate aldolase